MTTCVLVLGLKACDATRRALGRLGGRAKLRDVRAEPLGRAEIAAILAALGKAAVNRRSATWRGLGPEARQAAPEELLARHPALMKRPVLWLADGRILPGWTEEGLQQAEEAC